MTDNLELSAKQRDGIQQRFVEYMMDTEQEPKDFHNFLNDNTVEEDIGEGVIYTRCPTCDKLMSGG